MWRGLKPSHYDRVKRVWSGSTVVINDTTKQGHNTIICTHVVFPRTCKYTLGVIDWMHIQNWILHGPISHAIAWKMRCKDLYDCLIYLFSESSYALRSCIAAIYLSFIGGGLNWSSHTILNTHFAHARRPLGVTYCKQSILSIKSHPGLSTSLQMMQLGLLGDSYLWQQIYYDVCNIGFPSM